MRMLLADDHELFREAVSAMVRSEGAVEVVTVSDLASALSALAASRFDLVLLDYRMPGMNGLEGLDQMIAAADKVPVGLISGTIRRDLAEQALERGAAGYVPKTIGVQAMVDAVKQMAMGVIYAPLSLLDAEPAVSGALEELTRREREVLAGICAGKSNKEIARDLDVQEVTVKLHVKTLSRKLNARNRTHAAMIARDNGLGE